MHDYLKNSQEDWEFWSAINKKSRLYDVEGFKAGKMSLQTIESEELGDVAGKSLLHLQCRLGLETLSWARLGAQVTGVDFADVAIDNARSLSHEVGLNANFICSDIYDLKSKSNESFDIIYTAYGVLFWLPDLQNWADIIAHFLKPGGTFYIVEYHPFANIFSEDSPTDLRAYAPYFHTRFSYKETLSQPSEILASPAMEYRAAETIWSYSLGEVINALIMAGLSLEFIHEFPYMFLKRFAALKQGEDGLWRWEDPKNHIPLLFSLKATK